MAAEVTPSAVKGGSTFTTSTVNTTRVNPNFKVGFVTIPAATTSADTTTVNLWNEFGIRKFMGFSGWQHTTENSVIASENDDASSVTAVEGNTLTITVNGTAAASKRVYAIYGI